MNYAETLAAVLALNSPESKAEQMVYQVFEDGEITLQKGGSLLWQRTLHCVAHGYGHGLKPEDMAYQMRSAPHGYIFVKNEVDAQAARVLIGSMKEQA